MTHPMEKATFSDLRKTTLEHMYGKKFYLGVYWGDGEEAEAGHRKNSVYILETPRFPSNPPF